MAAAVASSLVAGCSPCAGIANCEQPAEALYQGQVVEAATGAPSSGVRVDVIRTGGASTAVDSTSFTTDAAGVFEGSLGAMEEGNGDAIVSIVVTSIDSRYRVDSVRVRAARVRGAAQVIEPWVRRPFFNYVGELWRADNPADRLRSTAVQFRRTAGASLNGTGINAEGHFEVVSDAAGRFYMMGKEVTAPGLEPVKGTVHVRQPDGTWRQVADHTLFPTYIFKPAFNILVLPFAGSSAPAAP